MLFLALAVLSSAAVANLIRFGESRRMPVMTLFAANYLVAAALSFAGGGLSVEKGGVPRLLGLGVPFGALFIGCFVLLMYAVKRSGLVVPVSLMRIAAVLPTLGSILVFGEQPGVFRLAGIALAFAALPLAAPAPLSRTELRRFMRGGVGWGLLLFLAFGATEFLFKVQKEALPVGDLFDLLGFIFGTAFVIGAVSAILRRERPSPAVLLTGAALGVCNMLSTLFFMQALRALPGSVVYPVNGIGVIALAALSGVLFWRERLAPRTMGFLAASAVALLLIA
jgi:drug/metabolite transporter (DMT)-like permease